jgi:hypothetical protein
MTAATFPSGVKSFGSDRVDGDYIPADDMNGVRAEVVALETAALAGGWLAEPLTWSYASASTFTVPGDRTAVYTKGARLRWVQAGSTKYGIVRSSSYSSTTLVTTVTILPSSDYVVLNMGISDNYYSNLDNPRGFPTWFSYAATLTGFSVPPATVSKYNVSGDKITLIHAEIGDGTSNTNSLIVSLPAPAAAGSSTTVVSVPYARDNGVYILDASGTILPGASTIYFRTALFATGWTPSGGKRVNFEIIYEW